MASKTNMTSPDDDHVQFGNNDSLNMVGLPPDFGPGDNFEFTSQYSGRVMVNPGNGGFGAAYEDPEDVVPDDDE